MCKLVVFLAIVGAAWPSMLLALEEQPIQEPDFNERLNQALGSEGGAQVYKNPEGMLKPFSNPRVASVVSLCSRRKVRR